ncbi:MAG: MBL fold metallo-hydrolase [Acidobacteriota bacterium]|nr:MBL fold metallo-hydrolase [Acidobacteriota bacterium]
MARLPVSIANVYFIGEPGSSWTLVDAGTPDRANQIKAAAEARFGPGTKPTAIVLTHGHFDHAGSARELAEIWNVPVYAHPLEFPFLKGQSAYPPKDPTVGGFMALLSRFFPSKRIDLGSCLQALPENGEVPGLPGWSWHHTPGHAPGQVSLFTQERSILLCGDAFTTLDLDSFTAMITQTRKISRPPAPMTYDWTQAHHSVEFLAGLRPYLVGAGHGVPMSGLNVAHELSALARHFPAPRYGRYAWQPAITDASGTRYVPPAPPDPLPAKAAIGVLAMAAVGYALARRKPGDRF